MQVVRSAYVGWGGGGLSLVVRVNIPSSCCSHCNGGGLGGVGSCFSQLGRQELPSLLNLLGLCATVCIKKRPWVDILYKNMFVYRKILNMHTFTKVLIAYK